MAEQKCVVSDATGEKKFVDADDFDRFVNAGWREATDEEARLARETAEPAPEDQG